MAHEGGGFGGRAEEPEEAALARQVAPLGCGLHASLGGGGGFRWTLGNVRRSVHPASVLKVQHRPCNLMKG